VLIYYYYYYYYYYCGTPIENDIIIKNFLKITLNWLKEFQQVEYIRHNL
jgi:hypothetical protein